MPQGTRLKDKVAIITGGGKGIGKAIALAFGAEGASVVAAGRTFSALEETCRAVSNKGGKAKAVVTDVAVEQQVVRMVEETVKEFGRVDILVNNTGITGPTVRLADMPLDKWNETLTVDLTGSMLCCREVLRYMIPRRGGSIVTIVSEGGRAGDGKSGFPLRSAYCAAKMGLIGMTETLSIEVGEYNIRVNAVSPGPVRGEHITNAMKAKAAATNRPFEEIMGNLAGKASLKRISEESEVAAAVVFLASDEASAITGQTLPVTCGQHINE